MKYDIVIVEDGVEKAFIYNLSLEDLIKAINSNRDKRIVIHEEGLTIWTQGARSS